LKPAPTENLVRNLIINVSYKTAPPKPTDNVRLVHSAFGIGLGSSEFSIFDNFDFEIRPGEIALITGSSGSGKSSLLRAFKAGSESHLDLKNVPENPDAALVDQFPCGFEETLRLLNSTGLGEAFLFLRRPSELSDGQRYRFRLARALSMKPDVLLIDEYCATLDRLLAKVISHNLRRTVTRERFAVIVATTHEDFIEDLQPDIIVRKSFGPAVEVERRTPQPRPVSFFDRLQVSRGTVADWKRFAPFHYKSHRLCAVDKIFRLTLDGEPIGIAVYAHPSLSNRLRNRVTGKRYCGRPFAPRLKLMNKELRVLQRVVLDGRFRGLGLGAHLVRESASKMSVPFIECLAVMGGYNRFLERAGFTRTGRCLVPGEARLLAVKLEEAGVSRDELSEPERLFMKISSIIERKPEMLESLRRWWCFRNAVKSGKNRRRRVTADSVRENLKHILHRVSRELFSAPYYFFLDNRKNCERTAK